MPDKIIVVHPKPKHVGVNSITTPDPGPVNQPKTLPQQQTHHVRIMEDSPASQQVPTPIPLQPTLNTDQEILPKRKESCSTRSVQMKVSLDQLTHDQPPNVDPIKDEAHQPSLPTGLMVTGFLQLLLGIIVISGDIVLFVSDAKIQEYLEISGSFTYESEHIKLGAQVARIAAGSVIIIGIMYGFNFLLHIYTHFLWLIVTLDLIVISCSLGTWTSLRMSIYERGFEAELLIYCEGNYDYIKIWEQAPANIKDKIKPGFWQQLEKDLKCCGINGPKDWKRMCNKIPESCCSELQPDCKRDLAIWNDDTNLDKNLSFVKDLLNEKACKDVLVIEHDGEHRDRVILPTVILIFDLLLMLNGNNLSKELILKLRKSKGRKEFLNYQDALWDNLRKRLHGCICFNNFLNYFKRKWNTKCGKKSNQIVPVSEPGENGRAQFVTDRVSLVQLMKPE